MQRSVEQKHAPSRGQRKRRDPRVRYFGFTTLQLPFLYVLVGNWLFAIAFFFIAKQLFDWQPMRWPTGQTIGDRTSVV